MTESATPKRPWVPIGVAVLLAVGIGTYVWFNRDVTPENGGASDAPIPEDEALRLISLKNTGLAAVENADFETAAAAFAEIIEKLPDDPFGHQNLAVTRVFILTRAVSRRREEADYGAQVAAAAEAATAQLQKLKEFAPDSAIPFLLEARAYESLTLSDSRNQEYKRHHIAALKVVLKHNTKLAHVWHDLFVLTQNSQDPAEKKAADDALKAAFQLSSENLLLLQEMSKTQAKAKDPSIEETLKIARRIAKPFVGEIKKRRPDYDLDLWIRQAHEALKKPSGPDWAEVSLRVTFWGNLIKTETVAKQDRARMSPHSLDYVIHDFNEKFYARARLSKPKFLDSIPVKLVLATGDEQLPQITDARAVRVVDFNLNDMPSIIVGREKSIDVWSRKPDGKGWMRQLGLDLPLSIRGIVAADLDRDSPKFADEQPLKPTPQKTPPPKTPTAKRKPKEESVTDCLTADVDLVAFGDGGVAVLRNHLDRKTGQRSLQPVSQSAEFQALRNIVAAGTADLDHDGDLDLILSSTDGISLWSNRGDMTFVDISEYSSLPPKGFTATAILPVDIDRNVMIDIVLTSGNSRTSGMLENVRHGRFRWRAFDSKFDKLGNAAAIAVAEVDRNVSWDLIAAGKNGITFTQTQTSRDGGYRFMKSAKIDGQPIIGMKLWDYDNDGYRDIFAWNAAGVAVFRGGPDGQFESADLFPTQPTGISDCEVADVDRDGDLDLVVVRQGEVAWLVNTGGNANNWVDIALNAERGAEFFEQRCNMHGVGSLLELKVGPIYQPRVVTGQLTHFGLGKRKQADVVRVLWTNGIPENVINPQARQSLCAQQNLSTGSCPYLYTWTGTKYEFLTDCLWAAPIGMQLADGVLAPARAWEYLRIPGEKLLPIDGEYRLQITEELWEAAYFDSIRLIAIDHPADVDMYSNEKVGPPSIAAYKIHTVKTPRLPVAARDQRGRDVLATIAKKDGNFLQAYDSRIVQGLTKEHFLELDLGKLGRKKNVTLFLTGWMFPSDPSINIAISQNPLLKHPQPPSLWVPDENGRWTNVMPNMGFPGGKTKTIAIDLAGKFLTDDYRVRIKTTMEIRWDNAFFTVDETQAEHRVTTIPVAAADLHYRGFSRRTKPDSRAPEKYDYTEVSPSPFWPPMRGHFTRYGDVTELLQADDDRLVVIGAGDEFTVRFRVPAKPIPKGWKRDFFLHNVGWDKDANANTVSGQSSEPLPFHAMKSYPFPPDVRPPDSPAYRDYLRKYQTRRQNRATFWKGIRRMRFDAGRP